MIKNYIEWQGRKLLGGNRENISKFAEISMWIAEKMGGHGYFVILWFFAEFFNAAATVKVIHNYDDQCILR